MSALVKFINVKEKNLKLISSWFFRRDWEFLDFVLWNHEEGAFSDTFYTENCDVQSIWQGLDHLLRL